MAGTAPAAGAHRDARKRVDRTAPIARRVAVRDDQHAIAGAQFRDDRVAGCNLWLWLLSLDGTIGETHQDRLACRGAGSSARRSAGLELDRQKAPAKVG
jgi:hypothetical protein